MFLWFVVVILAPIAFYLWISALTGFCGISQVPPAPQAHCVLQGILAAPLPYHGLGPGRRKSSPLPRSLGTQVIRERTTKSVEDKCPRHT